MPFSEFVGVSRKIDDGSAIASTTAIAPHVPAGLGVIVRTVAAGVDEKDLVCRLEFLLRLWKRVSHQAREGLAPEVIYTEMDLALRLVATCSRTTTSACSSTTRRSTRRSSPS